MPSIKQNPDIAMEAPQALASGSDIGVNDKNAAKAASIGVNTASANSHLQMRQIGFRAHNRLPDFRNLGVCLRILVIVNLIALLTAILQTPDMVSVINQLAELSIYTQPLLLLSFLALFALAPRLLKLRYRNGILLIMAIELILTLLLYPFAQTLFGSDNVPGLLRALLLSGLVTAFTLYYFNLRHRALSPAIAEARLQALQARIRPHFLFNSINAVLSVIRSQPKRAETALEDMADLFRVLMADNRELVPLAQEIALCRQYLALEKLRLDERLQIHWQIDNMPPDALIPPLLLQPLLENAVYHGIEPMPEGGEIVITIYSIRKEVHVILSNPYTAQGGHHSGNKMALTNIRERLALHFDAEATLTSKLSANRYEVNIVIPYQASSMK